MAEALDRSPDYRVLRRLIPRRPNEGRIHDDRLDTV